MATPHALADALERTMAGPMWHGPALGELLQTVTAAHAAARPIPGAHTIWELALHLTAWVDLARARLGGDALDHPPPDVDWPPPPAAAADASGASDGAAWNAAVARLAAAHHALAADVRALDRAALARPVPGQQHTVAAMLHGVVEHGAYHGGQIALLVRALGAAPAPGDYWAAIPAPTAPPGAEP